MRATVLLPPIARFAGLAGTTARWVARGNRIASDTPGRTAALRACFQFIGMSLPVAALTRSIELDDRDDAQWLRCDPAYLVADAVTLRLLACGDLALSMTDAEQLGETLKPLFGDAGFPLEITRPDRWYLRCAREARLPKFSAPADALGDDLARHLPEGDNAVRWRGLINEAQITLTQHPLNARRAQSGLPPVNSVWPWGGGTLPDWVKSEFADVISDDEVAGALARRAGSGVQSMPADADTAILAACIAGWAKRDADNAHRADRAILIDLAGRRDISHLDRTWLAEADIALKKRTFAQVELRFESGERVTLAPAHRWRVWRRVKALADQPFA